MFGNLKLANDQSFDDILADLRVAKKMTQAELAAKMDVSTATISRLETGEGKSYQQPIYKIKAVLDALTSTDKAFAQLLRAYATDCLRFVENCIYEATITDGVNRENPAISLVLMVELWRLSNKVIQTPQTDTGMQLRRSVDISLQVKKDCPSIFMYNAYSDLLVADEVDAVIDGLRNHFDVSVTDPAALEPCWACILVIAEGHADLDHLRDVIDRARTLRIPIIGLLAGDSIYADQDYLYEAIRLGKIVETVDNLTVHLHKLIGLRGQVKWWESVRSERDTMQSCVDGVSYSLGNLFVGRRDEIDKLTKALVSVDKGQRGINIYGPATGKTALAYQVMKEMERQDNCVVYRAAQFELEDLYQGIANVLNARQGLKNWWYWNTNPDHRSQYLLSQIKNQRLFVLLDGFDSKLDEDGQIADPELSRFIAEFLLLDHSGRLLITSTQPVKLDFESSRHLHLFPLEKGLSLPEGVLMLRKLDSAQILAETDDTVLEQIADKVEGLPKPLLLIYQLLTLRRSQLTAKKLLDDDDLFYGPLIEKMVIATQTHLSVDERHVMQALSVLGRTTSHVRITTEAVAMLLGDSLIDVQTCLDRLTAFGYIKSNHTTSDYDLWPWEQRFYYDEIPDDGETNIFVMERRAAQYYGQQLPACADPAQCRTFQWNALNHWMSARDYVSALNLLDQMSRDPHGRWDHDLLVEEGYFRSLISLRVTIVESLADNLLIAWNFYHLATIYSMVGQYHEASHHFKASLAVSLSSEDYLLRSLCLIGLGQAQRIQQDFKKALDTYRQALTLLDIGGDEYTRAICLDGLAMLNRDQGDLKTALNYSRQALNALQSPDEPKMQFAKAMCLETQARIYRYMVLSEKARENYEAALHIQQQLQERRGQLYVLNRLGMVSQDLGQPSVEDRCQQETFSIARQIEDQRGQCKALERLAFIHIVLGNFAIAQNYVNQAFSIANDINAPRILAYSHLRRGQIHLAHEQVEESLTEFLRAEQIFDNTDNRFDQQDCKNQIAKLHLIMDSIPGRSLRVVENALACNTEFYNHYSLVLKAVATLWAMPENAEEVRNSFELALEAAERILVKTPRFYSARFSRTLALAGIFMVSEQQHNLERLACIACGDLYPYRLFKGEIAEFWRVFKVIQSFDRDNALAPLEAALNEALNIDGQLV